LSSFVGRRRELFEIRRLLATSRLVTLTGVGGVGKTRLAIRVATQVRHSFTDGVCIVELAGLPDALLVPEAVRAALGIVDHSTRADLEMLAQFLSARQMLLVADNCEHLLPAVSRLLAELLRAAPGLRVLVTSREALKTVGEQIYPVAPLPVPEPDEPPRTAWMKNPAIALFAARAAAVFPGFAISDDNAALVARVCHRLDGIPLAIELAAARLRTLSLAQMAQRLDDRFRLLTVGNRAARPRHQTLRAAIGWSFDLCSKSERLMWMRATVFAGSFDLESAERVCGGDGPLDGEVLAALTGLVAKSVLVIDDEPAGRRYRLLDTLRQYGLAQLRDPTNEACVYGLDEAALRRRHLDYYVEEAERFHDDWFGPRQVTWSQRIHAELANLRAALGFCLVTPSLVRTGVRLAGALHYLWYACGQAREGRLWLERALAADPGPSRERVRAMAAYTRTVVLQGDFPRAADLAGQCLAPAHQFHEPIYEAEALAVRALLPLTRNDGPGAVESLLSALALASGVDPMHPQVAYVKIMLGVAYLMQGDPCRAGEMFAETQQICRAHGDQWYLGLVLVNSALQAFAVSDPARALADGRESLRLRLLLHDTYGAAAGLDLLARIAAANGDHERAARLLGAADRWWRAVGGVALQGELIGREESAAAARAATGDAVFEKEYRRGGDLGLDEAITYALGARPGRADRQARGAADHQRLTRRESEVAELVAQGLSNRQIATRLVISQRTAESHIENILTKFSFTNRTQIAAWYAKQRDISERS
jgi:predicted ATPase/DNA-binding CsgD family transcriptional regulator